MALSLAVLLACRNWSPNPALHITEGLEEARALALSLVLVLFLEHFLNHSHSRGVFFFKLHYMPHTLVVDDVLD